MRGQLPIEEQQFESFLTKYATEGNEILEGQLLTTYIIKNHPPKLEKKKKQKQQKKKQLDSKKPVDLNKTNDDGKNIWIEQLRTLYKTESEEQKRRVLLLLESLFELQIKFPESKEASEEASEEASKEASFDDCLECYSQHTASTRPMPGSMEFLRGRGFISRERVLPQKIKMSIKDKPSDEAMIPVTELKVAKNSQKFTVISHIQNLAGKVADCATLSSARFLGLQRGSGLRIINAEEEEEQSKAKTFADILVEQEVVFQTEDRTYQAHKPVTIVFVDDKEEHLKPFRECFTGENIELKLIEFGPSTSNSDPQLGITHINNIEQLQALLSNLEKEGKCLYIAFDLNDVLSVRESKLPANIDTLGDGFKTQTAKQRKPKKQQGNTASLFTQEKTEGSTASTAINRNEASF